MIKSLDKSCLFVDSDCSSVKQKQQQKQKG